MSFDLKSNIPALLANVHAALNEGVLKSAQDIVTDVEDQMVEPKSGVHYKGQPRTSSAPGEAPSVQSGDTQASYDAQPTGDLQAEAGSNSGLAAMLENGTVHMAARPALRPASERALANLPKVMGDRVNAAIEKSGF